MSMCDVVSDRMPAVASGRSEWTAEERAHLATCGECPAEWALVGAVAKLGRDVAVDEATLVPQLLARVRQAKWEERRRVLLRRGLQAGGLAIAATLLLVMVPRWRTAVPVRTAPVVVSAEAGELQLAELDDAVPAELEMVLVQFDEPGEPASSLDGPDLEGLDMSQVERALRSWEES